MAKPSTQVISTDLNPESPKMSLLMLLFCRALATDFVMLNPFLAKSMAGWTSCFHGNRPCCFQASYWPRTSPGTAMDRPPKKKLRYHLPLNKRETHLAVGPLLRIKRARESHCPRDSPTRDCELRLAPGFFSILKRLMSIFYNSVDVLRISADLFIKLAHGHVWNLYL